MVTVNVARDQDMVKGDTNCGLTVHSSDEEEEPKTRPDSPKKDKEGLEEKLR